MFFSILGSLIAFTLPLAVVDGFRPEHAGRVLLMGGIFGLVSALPLFLVFWGDARAPGIHGSWSRPAACASPWLPPGRTARSSSE